MIRLGCGHVFHHGCVKKWCARVRIVQLDRSMGEAWTSEHCPLCRCPIDDQLTRITGDGTILVGRDFRVSCDGGAHWSDEYNDIDAILADHFTKPVLRFERYSPARDHTFYHAVGESEEECRALIRAFTFFPQYHDNDDHVHRLVDGIPNDILLHFNRPSRETPLVVKARFWLSLVWVKNREMRRMRV